MREMNRFIFRWQSGLGFAIIGLFLFLAVAAPLLSPPKGQDPMIKITGKANDLIPHPPSSQAPLGTLPKQVSVFHSLVWGSRSALTFSIVIVLTTALFGILIGAASAYRGNLLNTIAMRTTDAFLAFPLIAGVVLFKQLLIFAMVASGTRVYITGEIEQTGAPSALQSFLTMVNPVMLAFILFSWMPYARITNSMVMRINQAEYVQAARAMGASHFRIILRHLIPNAITPAVVLAARDMGGVVLLQATFTFIGLGGNSAWGDLLARGRDWIIGPGGNPLLYWWVFIPPTLALIFYGIGWNLLGDSLNDLLNRRSV
jgi:peptide/nickel transport system permease protein